MTISNQQSAISNQQSAISNQQSAIGSDGTWRWRVATQSRESIA
jgi:hypothetical protein